MIIIIYIYDNEDRLISSYFYCIHNLWHARFHWLLWTYSQKQYLFLNRSLNQDTNILVSLWIRAIFRNIRVYIKIERNKIVEIWLNPSINLYLSYWKRLVIPHRLEHLTKSVEQKTVEYFLRRIDVNTSERIRLIPRLWRLFVYK